LKAQALEKNIASAREIMALLPRLDPMAHQTLAASLINPLIGYDAIPLPVIEEHYHTAGEVGEMLGVSAQKIGRVANANNLKTERNGKFFLDKSAHSNKQVEAFRYNTEGVKALRHLIRGADGVGISISATPLFKPPRRFFLCKIINDAWTGEFDDCLDDVTVHGVLTHTLNRASDDREIV
jgi:hypothetical protein